MKQFHRVVCFVIALKEACRGFSHIRNAEQLALDKRIIYTEALKGKDKLSLFASAHMGKYERTHEATLEYVSSDTHTPLHHCALERLGALLRETMEGLDLTLQSILLLSTQLSFSADEGCTESGRVFRGG